MAGLEVVRDKSGRVEAVDDHGRRRRVIRDPDGRLAGLEGQALSVELAERSGRIALTAAQVLDELTARDDEIARGLADVTDHLDAINLQLAGWTPADGGRLISTSAIKRAATRLGIQWTTIDVLWMTSEQEAKYDAQYNGRVTGVRGASQGPRHPIILRRGLTAAEIDDAVKHELCHSLQCELLVDDQGCHFDEAYTLDRDLMERWACQLAETVADIVIARKPSRPQLGAGA